MTTHTTSECHRRRGAFSLVELLAVVAIIFILLAMLIPGYRSIRLNADQAVCAANLRSLQVGFNSAVSDRAGRLLSSCTDGGWGSPASDWWTTSQSVKEGQIWPYVRNEKAFKCPSYPIEARTLLGRHYSVSTRFNSDSAYPGNSKLVSLSHVKNPSGTHVFIEEYDNRAESIGPSPGALGGFMVHNNWNNIMTDSPPIWHEMGANFSYLDGRVEYKEWEGPKMRTVDYRRWFYSQMGTFWPTTPLDAKDWSYFTKGILNGYIH